jgi:phage terminase small subunit
MASKKLSVKQLRFVDEYMKEPNATQAYIAAGYSENGAGQSAYTLLRRPEVAAELDRRRAQIAKKNDLTAERIMKELGDIALLGRVFFRGRTEFPLMHATFTLTLGQDKASSLHAMKTRWARWH